MFELEFLSDYVHWYIYSCLLVSEAIFITSVIPCYQACVLSIDVCTYLCFNEHCGIVGKAYEVSKLVHWNTYTYTNAKKVIFTEFSLDFVKICKVICKGL